jgi:hypothetical protein
MAVKGFLFFGYLYFRRTIFKKITALISYPNFCTHIVSLKIYFIEYLLLLVGFILLVIVTYLYISFNILLYQI